MMPDNTTPRPWHVNGFSYMGSGGPTGRKLVHTGTRGDTHQVSGVNYTVAEKVRHADDAALIVRAVNSFDVMRNALRDASETVESGVLEQSGENGHASKQAERERNRLCRVIRAALALAEKGGE